MTPSTPAARDNGRIVFHKGHIRLISALTPPPGRLAAQYSVISPGTERRRLHATVAGTDHYAGYMTIAGPGQADEPAVLAPVPHGAWAEPDDLRALPIRPAATIEAVAVARFQLMAALGLKRLPPSTPWAQQPTAVVGSGPVAVGCVLELLRMGATDVRSVTSRANPPVAILPAVTVTRSTPSGRSTPPGCRWPVVIDCVGRPERTLPMAAPGGVLGLLGTPDDPCGVSAVDLHRSGVTAVGMHELAVADAACRRRVFSDLLEWIMLEVESEILCAWCLRVPGQRAVEVYRRLFGAERPAEPFLILEWP